MLPPNWLTPWGPGALYAGLYVGLCRALVTPWLTLWWSAPGARSPAGPRPPTTSPVAAAFGAAGAPAATRPLSTGALIIPFDRTRARVVPRP